MIGQPIRTDSHMKDYEGHVAAVEADLEYYRTKRFESRLLLMARRGVVTFYDLIKAAADSPPALPTSLRSDDGESHSDHQHEALETRIRALEDRLDAYVRDIALIRADDERELVIEDNRKERGDYDPFFRIAKRHYSGTLEERIDLLNRDLDDGMLLLATLERALIHGGRATAAEMARRRAKEEREHHNGARIVARAWVDPEFKRNLIEVGREAVRELDIPPGRLGKLGVAEDTDTVHNVVVCTLCSCYPTDLLGNAPWWYRHDSYKENIVRDPRTTLNQMFGLSLPNDVQIRVHDSTSDIRWMVLPKRPVGTDHLSEEQLAELVTKDSLIGAGMALNPSEAGL